MENCSKNFKFTSKHYYFWLYNYLVIGREMVCIILKDVNLLNIGFI